MALMPLNSENIRTGELTAKECFERIEAIPTANFIVELSFPTSRVRFASLAFRVRNCTKNVKIEEVDHDSFDPGRQPFLKAWASSFIERTFKNSPTSTLLKEFGSGRAFIVYAEQQGCPDLFDSPKKIHDILINYSKHLHSSIPEKMHNNTAQYNLNIAHNICEIAFPNSNYNFHVGLSRIPFSHDAQQPTRVPSEVELHNFIKPLSDIFNNIYDFITNNETLPYLFNANEKPVWLLPDFFPIMSEARLRNLSSTYGTTIWRWTKQRAEQILSQSGCNFHEAMLEVTQHVKQNLVIGKIGHRKPASIAFDPIPSQNYIYDLCKIAHDCFFHLFTLATSGNTQPIGELIWDEFSYIERGEQNQRVIKNRAHTEINISFQARFKKTFDKYLQLRRILAGDSSFSYLFGDFLYQRHPKRIYCSGSHVGLKRINKLVPFEDARLTARELRAFGLNFKTNNAGVISSAINGGHSPQTSIRSYSTGNLEVNISEGLAFFSALGQRVEIFESRQTDIVAGDCASGAKGAVSLDPLNPTQPDCKNFISCIFCKNFFIHTNELDIRKLWSMHYIIDQLQTIQISASDFENTWRPTIARIEALLNGIKSLNTGSSHLVNRIQVEVYANEELTPFWQHKLNLLIRVGYFR